MDYKFKLILDRLNKKYEDLIFNFHEEEDSMKTYLLYKELTPKYLENINFDDIICNSFKICEEYLSQDEIDNIVVLYDCKIDTYIDSEYDEIGFYKSIRLMEKLTNKKIHKTFKDFFQDNKYKILKIQRNFKEKITTVEFRTYNWVGTDKGFLDDWLDIIFIDGDIEIDSSFPLYEEEFRKFIEGVKEQLK